MKEHLKFFLVLWACLLIANQIFLFNGCFSLYCIIAALPHTGVIAFILAIFIIKKKKAPQKNRQNSPSTKTTVAAKREQSSIELEDPLKKKGDKYEKIIGLNFEKKGDIVIYNGFIQGYEDEGVDIIAVSSSLKSINFIQCKNWTRKSMNLIDIIKIYEKLNKFDFSDSIGKINVSTIYQYLQIQDIDKNILINHLDQIRRDYRGYTIRKTLYISSEKVVNLEVGKYLTMIKKNIFRYKDMKIVLVTC